MPKRPIKQIPGTDATEQLRIYSAVMNYMSDEVHIWKIVFDEQGEIKTWRLKDANPAALKIWGKSLEDVLDKTAEEIFPGGKAIETFTPIIKKIYEEQKPHHWQSYFHGTNQVLDMVSIPVGEYFISTGKDVTLIKQADNFINQAHRMESLGVIAGGVVHDINNILGILGGNTRFLSKRNNQEELYPFIKGIEEATRKIQELTELILSFAAPKKSCVKEVSLSECLQSIGHLLESSLPETIEMKVDIDFSTPLIMANKININQIILNLANNALTAMRKNGGTLSLSLKQCTLSNNELPPERKDYANKGFACLTIKDSGSGMDAGTLENIFRPFYTTNNSSKGMGLGLAIVDTLVKNHHGFIDVKTKLNKGTSFNVYFPLKSLDISSSN